MARYAGLMSRIDEVKAASGALRGRIEELDKRMNEVKAAQDSVGGKLDAARSAADAAFADVNALHTEKKECWDIMQALRSKIGEIRSAYDVRFTEYKAQERAWRGWAAEDRKKRCAWAGGGWPCVMCCVGVGGGGWLKLLQWCRPPCTQQGHNNAQSMFL